MESLWIKSKNDTLDPLSIIIKLYIYSYKAIGTKISIYNNKMEIQDIGYFQSTCRRLNGDTKNDITILNMPILYACNIYLKNQTNDKMINLFQKASNSFDKLRQTYQGNEIMYNIDQLKNNIDAFLSNNTINISDVAGSYDSAGGKMKQAMYANINSIWTDERLNIVFNFINELEQTNIKELQEYLLLSLSSYMSFIDLMVHNLINSLI